MYGISVWLISSSNITKELLLHDENKNSNKATILVENRTNCNNTNHSRGRRGHDIMVVEFTTTSAISAYHH